MGRLSAGEGRRHPVTIIKASWCGVIEAGVSTAAPDRCAVPYSTVESARAKVAVRNIVAPTPQLEPASRLKSATRDVNFLPSDSRCRRYVSDLLTLLRGPRHLGSEQKGRVSSLWLTFSSRLTSLLLRKTADTVFVVLRFNIQVWRYSPTVAMSLLSTPSTACQSLSACILWFRFAMLFLKFAKMVALFVSQ